MHMRENLSLQYSNRVLDAITSQNLTFDTTKEHAERILLSGTPFQASQNTCVKLEIQIQYHNICKSVSIVVRHVIL